MPLNLLNRICEVENYKTTESEYKMHIINQYPKLFEGLGELAGEYEIKLRVTRTVCFECAKKSTFPFIRENKTGN